MTAMDYTLEEIFLQLTTEDAAAEAGTEPSSADGAVAAAEEAD